MGLDACVYCDCFERGTLKSSPRPEWYVYVTEDGARDTKASDLDTQLAFDRWNHDQACGHEDGVLLHHRIGNIALVGLFRSVLSERPDDFPLLLEKVVYSGSHCGDYMMPDQVSEMQPEIERLSSVRGDSDRDEEFLRNFEQQLRELLETVMRVGKPLVF